MFVLMVRRFLEDRGGNFALMASLLFVPLIGSAALAVDYSNISREKSELQQSLDSAILAIATKADGSLDFNQLNTFGTKFFSANMATLGVNDASMAYLGSTTNADGDVTVSAKGTKPFEGSLTTLLDDTVATNSAAVIKAGKPACTLALSKTAGSALAFGGNTSVSLSGCVLASNSVAANSVDRWGSADVAAECVQTPGGTSGINNDARTVLACGSAKENSFATKDPLESMVPASDVGCATLNIPGGKTLTEISPGTYCNSSIKVNGGKKIKFAPGTYVFKGTDISILGGAEVTGSGVTIFLYGGAKLSVAANAVFSLAAPTAGSYAGVAIYSAASNPAALKFNGGATQSIQGFVYNPKGTIDFSGNSSSESSKCMRLIADTITMTGNSSQKSNCVAELGGKEIRTVGQIHLVQ